ncbi:MAG TPA: non-heme iron oxygenase ferredoxin subunit [Pyrinomonadaceae bacterium]|nr:non-heme iron oxygenase ferredoxin subunit [Pyrinomonadaceae bacterium]
MRGCRPARLFVTLADAVQSFNSKSFNPKKPKRQGQTVTVGRVEDVPEGRGATVELKDGTELALYHIEGEFHAIENFCPHKGAPLADGHLCGHTVECDWHGWRFDVRTGQCLNRPHSPVETYEVLIEDGWIKIAV